MEKLSSLQKETGNMALMIAIRFGIGSYPSAEWVKTYKGEKSVLSVTLKSPRKLTPEEIKYFPRVYEVENANEGSEKQHFVDVNRCLAMSSEAKDVLETLEPGKHQFIEVQFNPARHFKHLKSYYEGNTYYFAKICQTLQAVDIEHSVLKEELLYKGTEVERLDYQMDLENKDKVVLNSDIIKDNHIWFNEIPALFGRLFISDTLKKAWEDKLNQTIIGIHCNEV